MALVRYIKVRNNNIFHFKTKLWHKILHLVKLSKFLKFLTLMMRFKLLLIVFAIVSVSNFAFAQRQKTRNLPFYDERKLHYGFAIGLHQSRLHIQQYSDLFANRDDLDTLKAAYPLISPGFSLGIILNARLGNELWNLRFVPNVCFYERSTQYTFKGGSTITDLTESTFIELPLLVKYKSLRRNNTRLYMIGGLSYNIKVGGKKELLDAHLTTADSNLEVQYGFGWDRYLDMFKFALELRFAHGIPNILSIEDSKKQLSDPIGRLTTHKVTLYLNFE